MDTFTDRRFASKSWAKLWINFLLFCVKHLKKRQINPNFDSAICFSSLFAFVLISLVCDCPRPSFDFIVVLKHSQLCCELSGEVLSWKCLNVSKNKLEKKTTTIVTYPICVFKYFGLVPHQKYSSHKKRQKVKNHRENVKYITLYTQQSQHRMIELYLTCEGNRKKN